VVAAFAAAAERHHYLGVADQHGEASADPHPDDRASTANGEREDNSCDIPDAKRSGKRNGQGAKGFAPALAAKGQAQSAERVEIGKCAKSDGEIDAAGEKKQTGQGLHTEASLLVAFGSDAIILFFL
jgi:hypothetical protein